MGRSDPGVRAPEWLEDQRFKTPALRDQNINARLQLTQEACSGRAAAEWLERRRRRTCRARRVLTRNEVIRHPQVRRWRLSWKTTTP